MKLMTHNFLSSKFLKGVTSGYPLLLTATKKEIKEHEYNEGFVRGMLDKLDYSALMQAATSVDEADGLPVKIPSPLDESFLRKLHRILVSVEIIEGELKCPESGRVFPISSGIPNMLADASEIS